MNEEAAILERGRAAYARRDWSDAFLALEEADQQAPLVCDDLELLTWSAALAGRDQEFLKCLERLTQLHLDAERYERAMIVAFWLSFRLVSIGEGARASGWLVRCERMAERVRPDSVVHGYMLLPECRRHLAAGDFEAAVSAAERAAACAERCKDGDLATFARTMIGRVLVRSGNLARGLAVFDECILAVAGAECSPMVAGLVYCTAIAVGHRVHALDRTREWTDSLARWCKAQPQLVTFSTTCLVHRAEILQLSGAWPEAIEEAERAALRCPPTMAPQDAADALYQQAEIRRLRGELAEAEELYRAASQKGREPQPGLSLLRAAQGQHEAAAVAIRRVLAGTTEPFERARHLPAFVEIMVGAGATDEARRGSEELGALAARYETEILRAMADHAEGTVALAEGNAEKALVPLRAAFRAWQHVCAPYIAARIRMELAAACRALGDDEGARLEIEAASEIFEKLGAVVDRDAARRALERLDGSAPRRASGASSPVAGKSASGPSTNTKATPAPSAHGLTARELEVLRQVASGKTNKAIAKELFLSEKTVDRHVSNIFAKLNVATRAAATAYAYEHGLV